MKKVSLILIAIALVLGMSQCKKEKGEQPAAPSAEILGNPVNITVKVADGAKHIVYPNSGAYAFTAGDLLYVGLGGKYVGTLTFNQGSFSGDIYTEDGLSGHLYFYFVGGLDVTPNTTNLWPNATKSMTVDISNQEKNLPVLSCGMSDKVFNGTGTYTCALLNQCALVEFSFDNGPAFPVTISGMNNKATINFENGTITPTGETGEITLYAETSKKQWAILLPQAAVASPTAASYMATSITAPQIPPVDANTYLHGDNAISMTASLGYATYTINANGDKVVFSPSNLRANYLANANKWDWYFDANDQSYAYLGDYGLGTGSAPGNDIYAGPVSLFGWSTTNPSSNYGLTNVQTNTPHSGSFVDWGSNSIRDDKTGHVFAPNTWRTLTAEEWDYLLNQRETNNTVCGVTNARYAALYYSIYNGGNAAGLILFPDEIPENVDVDRLGLNNTQINNVSAPYWGRNLSSTSFKRLNSVFSVFLPKEGYRDNTTIQEGALSRSSTNYWSSTTNSANEAMIMYAYCGSNNTNDPPIQPSIHSKDRYMGCCVRLVRDVR